MSKEYIGYTRVSTVKQGTKGVSLAEQRDAISRYAERNQLSISVWLEEMETAAKQGRPVFNKALKMLRSGDSQGIILHKLDRGARNLKDWAAIGELSDQGTEVHFVSESIDLQTRGGRLSADIQAVVAADYIRNLREETRKGFYGRLKQGFYPMNAPVGYLNQGGGKAKTIDPIAGPLVRKAFELYGSGQHSFETLAQELYRLGLHNNHRRRITNSSLTTLLNNPFYIGVIQIRKTAQTFIGVHEPLISKKLFDRVHAVLTGKTNARTIRHSFRFRRTLTCKTCHYSLIGERQKGHVYYRCHSKQCRKNSIREELVEAEVNRFFERFHFSESEVKYFRSRIAILRDSWATILEDERKSLGLRCEQIKDRLNRLTDAYLDQALDRSMYDERKKNLLFDQKAIEQNLTELDRQGGQQPNDLEKFLELAGNAWLSHQLAIPEEMSEMLKICTSNCEVYEKNVDLKPSMAFQDFVQTEQMQGGAPHRDIPRIWNRIIDNLTRLNASGQLPDLSAVPGFLRYKEATDSLPDGQGESIEKEEIQET